MNQITPADEAISLANCHYNRVEQARKIQEVMDMGNRPGIAAKAAYQDELEKAKKGLEKAKKELELEKQRSNTVLNYMLIAMILAFAISLVSICLTIGLVLR